jgi:hypothetical protein
VWFGVGERTRRILQRNTHVRQAREAFSLHARSQHKEIAVESAARRSNAGDPSIGNGNGRNLGWVFDSRSQRFGVFKKYREGVNRIDGGFLIGEASGTDSARCDEWEQLLDLGGPDRVNGVAPGLPLRYVIPQTERASTWPKRGGNTEGTRLFWELKKDRQAWRESREGAYVLRTNLKAETAEELWAKYMQLTEAEASFRALKSELSIRPLFHQKESRVKAHVMVAFLGYAMWVTLKHLLKRRAPISPKPSTSGVDNAQPLSPMKALFLLSTLQSADIVLPTTDGHEIRLRRITEPTAEQKSLLQQLRLTLPNHLQHNRECSVDSAIA